MNPSNTIHQDFVWYHCRRRSLGTFSSHLWVSVHGRRVSTACAAWRMLTETSSEKRTHKNLDGDPFRKALYGGFQKWGYPNSWMVYKGKITLKWMIWGTPILGNLHMMRMWKLREHIIHQKSMVHELLATVAPKCCRSNRRHQVKKKRFGSKWGTPVKRWCLTPSKMDVCNYTIYIIPSSKLT